LRLIEALKHQDDDKFANVVTMYVTFVSTSMYTDRISEKGEEFTILTAVALPGGNYVIISRRLNHMYVENCEQAYCTGFIT